MLIVIIPYLLALAASVSFLSVLRRFCPELRPEGAMLGLRMAVVVVSAQILVIVFWRSGRPWWMPMCLSVIPVAACLLYAIPVIAETPEILFSPAAIRRWRRIRTRLSRTLRKGN